MNDTIRQKLLGEFETMRLMEQDAHEFYLKASTDPSMNQPTVRKCFSQIAEDEKRHVELVERIMNIIRNCM